MQPTRSQPRRAFREEARSEWAALGALGRSVLVALAMSAVVAVALAVVIPRQVERHLIDGEIRSLSRIAGDFAEAGMIPPKLEDSDAQAALDTAVRVNLLGSDTVRVKVWARDGTITYSDTPDLIGQVFPASPHRTAAFGGEPTADIPDLSRPENAHERDLLPLREFYIPVRGESGTVISVFEVYQLREPIETTVGNIKGYVWISVGIAIGLLGGFIAILILTNGRAIARRRQLTERLFRDLVRSQADERGRIIGSLHDDIGQSLYRIHYGLEDMKSRLDGADAEIVRDLDHLGALVTGVDAVLRAELRLLQYGTGEELSLGSALDELAELTEMESDLTVSVGDVADAGLTPDGRVALFQAAREAVTNIRKHASATSVFIQVEHRGRRVRLDVSDDGVGMGEEEGLGLTVTRERLEAIGGGLRVTADRRGGTRFAAWVPATLEEVET